MSTSHKGGVMLLVFLICVLGIVAFVKYDRYIHDDPGFCSLCHRTAEGYDSWERSAHFEFPCQRCHEMSVIEGNKLLIAYYVKGDSKIGQSHGRTAPWQRCIQCHGSEAAQGSITFRQSFGHARHVFMREIGCAECHSGRLHELKAESGMCQECHADKLVHGMGTVGLECLMCHEFGSEEVKMVPDKRCNECHTNLKRDRVMANLKCHDCHHPHDKLSLSNEDCLGNCHSSETRVGEHGKHIGQLGLSCTYCHKPHIWEVRRENSRGLCDKCHKYRDPMKFIY